jgi:hypothetical protein
MANKNILTSQAKTVQVEQVYYSPVAVVPPYVDVPLSTMYCFLSKVEPWNDDVDPPAPTTDVAYQKQVFKNMFAVKQITASNISPVIRRINWESGTKYAYYRDDIEMNEVDSNGFPVHNYYVKNKYDQVFKCLCNGATEDNLDGLESTDEPFFEPGSYQTNGIFQKTDGYKWKYMYSIDTGLKVKFMDDDWMPVAVGQNTPNPAQTTAGAGSVDVISVLNGGSGYDTALSAVTVVVTTGDGTGLTATATVTDGSVTDVSVTNAGSNYSYATVEISSGVGSGAVLYAPTSPIGGHGFDPVSELGSTHVMITAEFNASEGGSIPVDVDFHQIGLLVNPTSKVTYPNPANNSVYRTTTDVYVSAGPTVYTTDEFVYQGTSLANSTFSGRVLYHNTSTNELNLINTVGTPTLNEQLFGETSTATRTLLSYNTPELYTFSGYITYIENRSAIQRSPDGIEQFRFVLGY